MEKIKNVDCRKASVQGEENYFIDSLLYQDSFKLAEDPTPENHDYDNESDIEPEQEEEYLWEINPLIMSVDTLDFNNTANVEGE